MRACRATQRDATILMAADEQPRINIGRIDQMLARRQVFLHRVLLDGSRAHRFTDRSGGRMHVRQQARCRRLTRFTNVYHVAGPLDIPFVAVPCLGVAGRFNTLGSPRQVAIRLEAHVQDGVVPHCGSGLSRRSLWRCQVRRSVVMLGNFHASSGPQHFPWHRERGTHPRPRSWPRLHVRLSLWAGGCPRSASHSAHTTLHTTLEERSLAGSRAHGVQLVVGLSEGLGDQFQPSQDADGRKDMRGVRPLLSACLEEP
jgi:hypothetical protein